MNAFFPFSIHSGFPAFVLFDWLWAMGRAPEAISRKGEREKEKRESTKNKDIFPISNLEISSFFD